MKSLFFITLMLVLYGMGVGFIRDYIYISQSMPWPAAQNYCRIVYTDLANITTEVEHQRAMKVSGQSTNLVWIGLFRPTPHVNQWQWSGREQLNFTKWRSGEPNDKGPGEDCAAMDRNGWNDDRCTDSFPFICLTRLTLVKEKKTWDEALKHCRRYYSDLTFVDSKALLDLPKAETEQAQTASMWTGLRFLDGKWFWVNGMQLESLVSLPACPAQPYRCGAYNLNTNILEDRDCNEELNFLCYY